MRGSCSMQSCARSAELVGITIETFGQSEIFKRARLAVGYSMISAGRPRRSKAADKAARLVLRASGFPPPDPEAMFTPMVKNVRHMADSLCALGRSQRKIVILRQFEFLAKSADALH